MTTLLERDEQLHAAAGYLADAAAGHGRLVYVGGEAGVGKTTFLDGVAARVDARVVVGWCDGSATPPPLGPLGRAATPTASPRASRRCCGWWSAGSVTLRSRRPS